MEKERFFFSMRRYIDQMKSNIISFFIRVHIRDASGAMWIRDDCGLEMTMELKNFESFLYDQIT